MTLIDTGTLQITATALSIPAEMLNLDTKLYIMR
jgi:hypothetical protein